MEPGDTQLEVAAERGEVAAEADCLRFGELGAAVLGCDTCFFCRWDWAWGSGMADGRDEAADAAPPLLCSLADPTPPRSPHSSPEGATHEGDSTTSETR